MNNILVFLYSPTKKQKKSFHLKQNDAIPYVASLMLPQRQLTDLSKTAKMSSLSFIEYLL